MDTVEYRIVKHTNKQQFEQNVAHFLQDGWNFVGGVSVVIENTELTYFQAIERVVGG